MATVALIMKRPGNIRVMHQTLGKIGLSGMGVSSEAEFLRLLEGASPLPCLALIDVSDFGPRAWQMCKALRNRNVPFIVMSAPRELEIGRRSLAYGAASVLQKPVAKSTLLQLIRSLAQ
ncbi:MAG: response regulator [Aquisalimonadaceae bacterium]